MPVQKCPLCLLNKNVVRSHLIPRAVYDFCRVQRFEPVMMTSEAVRPTSRQVWAHLLCKECEDLLNSKGERWLLPLLAEQMGQFPLFDLLRSVSVIPCDVPGTSLCATVGSGRIERDKLVHLALGIFWKASVQHWVAKPGHAFLDLPEEYREGIRRFLRSEGPLPDDVALVLTVTPSPVKDVGFTLPVKLQRDGFEQHVFYLPGMKFDLLTGKGLKELKRFCLHSSPEGMVIVEDLTEEIKLVFRAGTRNARRTQKYHSDMKEIGRLKG